MNELLRTPARLLARGVVLAAALVLAASLAAVMLCLLGGWVVYAGWARLSGRPIRPFGMRLDPRAGFQRAWQRSAPGASASRTPRADATRPGAARARGRGAEPIDVEPRIPSR
jgi:hypothetical protein